MIHRVFFQLCLLLYSDWDTRRKIQVCPPIWITSQMTLMTRQMQGTHWFFLTLGFLGLPLFLKSAGGPLQNNSKSETELRGIKRQTWGTAGNLTDMLSRSITQKLEIKFKISFKKKKVPQKSSYICLPCGGK